MFIQEIQPLRPVFYDMFVLADNRIRKERDHMAKDRFVEVYSQGLTNVEKIIVDKETGVNYLLAASTLTAGCGMSVLVDQNEKPIVTPIN